MSKMKGEEVMVDKVERIRGTASATPTRVNESLSITSEPDNAWIAQRQSAINEDLRGDRC